MSQAPTVRGDQVVKAREKVGFQVVRIRGSHHVLRHSDGRGTTVPVHHGRDVAKGTLRNILADAGLIVEEFKRLI